MSILRRRGNTNWGKCDDSVGRCCQWLRARVLRAQAMGVTHRWRKEPGARLQRYFESRGPADRPRVICSAVSFDMLNWELEKGIRLQTVGGVGGPRYLPLPDGRGRLYCFGSEFGPIGLASGKRISTSVISAITSDMAGYRSRIFVAYSTDGLAWERAACAIDGLGYGGPGLDAVHAEDMSMIKIGKDTYRMYYAACDKDGNWRIASAVTEDQA